MDANWQSCIDAFLSHIEDMSGSTHSCLRYDYVLRSFFHAHNPDEMTRSDVQAFLDAPSTSPRNHGANVSPATKNNRLMVLNSFYKFASTFEIGEETLLETKPPTFGISYLKVGISPHALTADELERFFAAIPKSTIQGLRDRAVFLLFFWTGRRRSEIARLLWKDIEQAVIVEPNGRRRPCVIYHYISIAHSRETNMAGLPMPASNAFLSYLQRAGRFSTMQPDTPLFVSVRQSQRHCALTGDRMNVLFKIYCTRAGLSPRYSLHSLRHCAARERYMAGSSIQDIQVFLGHASLATTDIYLKRLTGTSDPGAALLEHRFGHL
jgi:site-specific recombinase XerD